MKTLTAVLLVVLLCVERASSLHCYKCENAKSHKECQSVRCADTERYCVKQTIRRHDHPLLINKWCSEVCPQSIKGGEVNIECCQEDNCNTGGSASVKASSAVLGLATLASFFYVLRTGL